LARMADRIERRSPSPPARMTARIGFTGPMLHREGERGARDGDPGLSPV
jgi:hypothetical protein